MSGYVRPFCSLDPYKTVIRELPLPGSMEIFLVPAFTRTLHPHLPCEEYEYVEVWSCEREILIKLIFPVSNVAIIYCNILVLRVPGGIGDLNECSIIYAKAEDIRCTEEVIFP